MNAHPTWLAFDRARKRLSDARSRAKDDGMFPMRDMARQLAQSELRTAEAKYAEKRAAWEEAGMPNREGKRVKKRRRA